MLNAIMPCWLTIVVEFGHWVEQNLWTLTAFEMRFYTAIGTTVQGSMSADLWFDLGKIYRSNLELSVEKLF